MDCCDEVGVRDPGTLWIVNQWSRGEGGVSPGRVEGGGHIYGAGCHVRYSQAMI